MDRPTGYRFQPSDQELVGTYLYNHIFGIQTTFEYQVEMPYIPLFYRSHDVEQVISGIPYAPGVEDKYCFTHTLGDPSRAFSLQRVFGPTLHWWSNTTYSVVEIDRDGLEGGKKDFILGYTDLKVTEYSIKGEGLPAPSVPTDDNPSIRHPVLLRISRRPRVQQRKKNEESTAVPSASTDFNTKPGSQVQNFPFSETSISAGAADEMGATTPKYSNARCDEISAYLKMAGYKPEKIPFILISGFEGENMIERSTNLDWYKAPTLLEAPLPLPLLHVYKSGGIGVDTRVIKPGMVVTFGPTEVKSVEMHHEALLKALPSDNAGLNLKCGFLPYNSKDGQTGNGYASLFGVKQMIFGCSKMDATTLKARYDKIVEVSYSVNKVAYNHERIPFVPISKRPREKPLPLPLQDVYIIGGIGIVPVGCVETGVIKPGMIVTFGPIAVLTTEVKTVEMHHEPLLEALSGDNVGFNLKNIVKPGFVASNSKDDLAKEDANFTSRIIMVNHPGQIGNSYAPVLAHIAIKSAETRLKIGRSSSKELEKVPKFLKNGDARMVKIIPTKPMVVDTFTSYPFMGRFSVRDMRRAVYVGVIKSMEKKDLTGAKVTKA